MGSLQCVLVTHTRQHCLQMQVQFASRARLRQRGRQAAMLCSLLHFVC